jgi:hypothetical protein
MDISNYFENKKANCPLSGKRVELIAMNDDPYPLPAGTKGTVEYVDDMGTVRVKWDSGSTLGLIPNVDEYRIIE